MRLYSRTIASFYLYILINCVVSCQLLASNFAAGTAAAADVCEAEDDSCRTTKNGARHIDAVPTSETGGNVLRSVNVTDRDAFGPAVHPCTDDRWDKEIAVFITFTNAVHNIQLQDKFRLTVSSMLRHTTIQLLIHIIGDSDSRQLAKRIIEESLSEEKQDLYTVKSMDVDTMARQLDEIVRPMQSLFSYKTGAYYNHALFFLSIAIHRLLPNLCRAIMLDADLKIVGDVRDLAALFREFSEDNLIGIARDGQPVYRHALWQYRRDNPGTRVGQPPPDGLTGFNSGVLLLNLHRIRESQLYNSLLTAEAVGKLAAEFHFKGHLGDQDFFSLLSFRYEQLFYVLPCNWNRQLCTWWGKNGYADIIDLYHRCEGPIYIYHGNCNTPIP